MDQRKALRQLEEECEAERQSEYRNQSQQGRLSESVEIDANERHIERDRQRQSEQSLFQHQSENQSKSNTEKEPLRESDMEQHPIASHDPAGSTVTPDTNLGHARRVSPGIRAQMRQFENADMRNESGANTSDESDNEFYTQYVQGTNPRNFGGVSTNDDKMSVGDGGSDKAPSGEELSTSNLQTIAEQVPNEGDNVNAKNNDTQDGDKDTSNI